MVKSANKFSNYIENRSKTGKELYKIMNEMKF